ncbi:unnamed protein product [Kluyveromyces dobzhanskii CBS 2104]|uniref:6-phosphogluconolactonase-like protein n=1 Tax=Kluyveromyces dobzhanskii CBS 2104 TaxID=1427455 RepID=A0A0A8LCZ8_9SACH|nr:unnamed protein product [Kluyveromyces dobzhanskii CBS 2104]
MVSIHEYSNSNELATSVGTFIVEEQNKALKSHGKFNVAISGGSLIKVLREALVNDATVSSQVEWSKWHIYFSDERLVPLEHEDSNYGSFKDAVLEELTRKQVIGPVVYTINESLVQEGKSENEKVAKEYESLLPDEPFDLILLGCGPDGHTCSLFPGEAHKYLLEEKTRQVMWCHDSPKPPSDRITITLPVLSASKAVAFVAEGSGKVSILDEIFNKQNQELPCTIVNSENDGKTRWFVNSDAVKGLGLKTGKYST